jgi:hypothetical protein
MFSSLTHTGSDATFTLGYRRDNSLLNLQWEVALLPLSKPASASRKEPTQTDPSRRRVGATPLSQANSAGSRMLRVPRPQTSNKESTLSFRPL